MKFPNIFAPAPPVQQQQQPNPQGQQQQVVPPNTASTMEQGGQHQPNPNNAQGQNQENKSAASPFEPYKDLWAADEVKDGDKNKSKSYLNIDSAKLREGVSKVDFKKVIDPAMAAKAMAGDVNSFMEVLNTVAQAAMANALQGSASFVERGLTTSEGRIFERLPSELKRHSLSDASFTENPALNHPGVRPMLQAVQAQFTAKYPDASTQEIAKMSKDYLVQMSKEIVGKTGEEGNDGARKLPANATQAERVAALQQSDSKFDWDVFAGMEEEQQAQAQ
jgi:hypothetical protein